MMILSVSLCDCTVLRRTICFQKCFFFHYSEINVNEWQGRTYRRLFLSHSLIDCPIFTLCALLNSNSCLDGIQPVSCNCLYRTQLVVLVYYIHEMVSRKVKIDLISSHTQLHGVISEPSSAMAAKYPTSETHQ